MPAVSSEEAHVHLTQWLYLLTSSSVVFAAIFYFTFQRQMAHRMKIRDCPSRDSEMSQDDGAMFNGQNDHMNGQNNKTNTMNPPGTIYTPENCFKYTSCVLSTVNCFIVAPMGVISFFYHKYWEDPLYGEPGIASYGLAIFASYLGVDTIAMVAVYFKHNMSLLWDVILHHVIFIACVIALMHIMNGWIVISGLLSMEISTIFLNGQFMAKWYKCSESVIFKFKLGFVISWLLVRVPVALIGMPIYCYLYGGRMLTEWTLAKGVGYLAGSVSIILLQLYWTILILKKMYRTLFAKDTVSEVDNFDLVQKESGSVVEEKSKTE